MKKALSIVLTLVFVFFVVPTGLFSISASAETNEIYTITYHLDGGTNALKNPDVYTQDDVITLMDATKVGYNFIGWFLDENMTEQIAEISNMTGNIELYAKFAAKSYIGVFNDNGATSSNSICIKLYNSFGQTKEVSLNNGDVFDPYAYWVPTCGGYVFLGWYHNSELVSSPLKISQDLSLEAKWSKCGQTNNDGVFGGGLNSVNVSSDVYDDVYSDSAYVYISAGITTVYYEGESVIRNVYYLNQYKTTISGSFVIYDETNKKTLVNGSNGGYGEKSGELTVAPGTLLRITATGEYAAVNLGYSANGMCSLTAGKRRSSKITIANQRQIEQKFDSAIDTPNVIKTGYDLLGWYDADGNQMPETWKYTVSQTFTAKWTPIEYNILYNLDGGTNHASNPEKYTIEDNIDLNAPTKPGYTFVGWYLDGDFINPISNIANQTGNLTLYAKWEVNSYNLTTNANEGAFAPKVTFISDGIEIKKCYLYEQDILTAYRPNNKEGYIFAGWYKDASLTELFKFNGTVTDDVNLYAKWVECSENIINIESIDSFETTVAGRTEQLYAFVPLADGKIVVSSSSDGLDLYGILYLYAYNTKYKLIESDDISDNNLDFSYTYNVKEGQLYYIAVKGNTVSTAGEATINVDWTGNCSITGTTYPDRQTTIVYDTNYTLPEKPTREGYVFLGWFDENDTQITDGIWNFVTDKTLTAKWEEATYHTIVFKDIDGNIISSETYYLSEDIIAPALPTKAPDNTYIYHAKWDNDYTGVCIGDAVYSPTFDAEYIEYTVVFVDEDGTELSRGTYHWGDIVTAPAAPSKATDANYANAYTFAGWDNPVINCEGDTTYTATYTAAPLKELVVTSLPEKVRYIPGESINLTGLALQLVYDNGSSVSLVNVDTQFVSADLSTSGRKTATIAIAGVSAEFEIYVHDTKDLIVNINSSLYPQSTHVYSNNLDETKTFTYPGAVSLIITFNSQTSVESNYDYIYIYDGAGNQIAKYSGTQAASETLTIEGDTFKVRLTTDSTVTKYGYAFSIIQANMGKSDEIIHQPVTDPATVTCTQGGLTEGSHCEICGDVLVAQEEVTALGHQYKTIFTWSDDHTSCAVTITCERGCGIDETIDCVVTHSQPHKSQTFHNAVAEFNGERFTDYLTCDNFLVVFNDWDDTQISSTYYHIGDTVIVPSDPNRLADNTYTYSFTGWDSNVTACNGNKVYTATYASTYIDYTVTFKNYDGTVLSSRTYHYGDKVTIPNAPAKAADNTYTYAFAGWDKTVTNCAGDATYTATFTPTYIDYNVTFKDWNGTTLSTKICHYGDTVIAPVSPTRAADNTYTYTFAGWDSNVTACSGDKVYTATYTSKLIDYTIIFKNYDGSVLSSKTYHYGDVVTAPDAPTKAEDDKYTYVFAGWDSNIVACSGNKIYTATFDSIKKYTTGDIDDDGELTDWDGVILARYLAGWNVEISAIETLDIDGDGEITDWDGVVLDRYLAGWNVEIG
ncbi:MAG: InlB B-repeat-containing protein [Clostridia bacterium]|nr:InlB B-repeat-containing protein [Clostridia bacterium]